VDKLSVLRASHRVLRPGGVLCFAVIAHGNGLTGDEAAEALAAGPDHADAGPGYERLMATAGFQDVDVTDATDAYLVTLTAWVREWDAEATELARVLGADEFAERQAKRRRAIRAARTGLLRRYILTATSPLQ
jgi:SAM-dependent methyltransferase